MNSVVAAAFRDGAERVILIGTDCPQLDESHLTTAFRQLANHDIVIGPATDSGYYLIGMLKHLPSLFENITWGTETVLMQTLAQAKAVGARLKKLAARSDVDYIEDLIHCRQVEGTFCKVLPQTTTGRISIIIPTWNEAGSINHTLQELSNIPDVEIIVADGGVVEFGANLRSRWLKLPYGDQAIFERASTFF